MSYQAIYEVTRGLRMLLQSQLALRSASAVVTLLPPGDTLPDVSGVNLYLYRVVESPFTRNEPWRGDRVTPLSNRPALGLQLSYLLTPLGARPDDASFTLGDDAHTMLGVAMQTLHQHPILNDVHLAEFDADAELADFILESYEKIKVTLAAISLEELSKIWATINKPYRLSVAYDVSLAELAPTTPPPLNGGIVTNLGLQVTTIGPPRLRALAPASGPLARLVGAAVTANDLQISGAGLSFPGRAPVVRVAGQPAPVKPLPAPTSEALTVTLPTDVDGGPQADVRVRVSGRSSAPLTFTVSLWLARVTPVRTALDPARPEDATLTLAGSGFGAAPNMRFEGPTQATVAANPGGTDTVETVPLPGNLANGLYGVRVLLADGSLSNARTLEVIPHLDAAVGVADVVVNGDQVHRLTLAGARLAGADVRLVLDDRSVHHLGANANSGQIVATLGRRLEAGTHRAAVHVDGSLSRTAEFGV